MRRKPACRECREPVKTGGYDCVMTGEVYRHLACHRGWMYRMRHTSRPPLAQYLTPFAKEVI